MGENSGISWCHHTLNWWMGCTKISAGCRSCYAEKLVTTRMRLPVWGDKAERKATSASTRKQVHTWNRKAREAGERHRVFCSSLSDVFEDRPDLAPMRAELFAAIVACPDLDFLLLTKRPENMVRLARDAGWSGAWPSNVWAGCTVENQAMAHERIPHLLQVPASVRFLSCEPLLEQLDLDPPMCDQCGAHGDGLFFDEDYGATRCRECSADGYGAEASYGHWLRFDASLMKPGIHWVIAGGESGPGARPFDLRWASAIQDECHEHGAMFFMKQMGAHAIDGTGRLHFKDKAGADPAEWPVELQEQAFPTR